MDKNILLIGLNGPPHSGKSETIRHLLLLPKNMGQRSFKVLKADYDAVNDYTGDIQEAIFKDPTSALHFMSEWMDAKFNGLRKFVSKSCDDGDVVVMENDLYYQFNVSKIHNVIIATKQYNLGLCSVAQKVWNLVKRSHLLLEIQNGQDDPHWSS